jgi:pimeloyl-ACP methyl ester carboxylesterase
MGFFRTPDGADIYFETNLDQLRDQKKGRPWITFVCGHTRTIHDYQFFKEQLTALGYPVLLFENRGSGRTVSSLDFTAEDLIEDVVGLWAHLKISITYLAGFSMGGYLAMGVAANAREKIAGLILISTSAWGDHVNGDNDSWLTSMENMEEKLASFFSPEFVKSNPDYMQTITRLTIKAIEDGRFATRSKAQRESIMSHEVASKIPNLTMPALVLHGDVDRTIEPSAATRLAEALPNSKLAWIPGAAHFTPIEKPKLVLDHMLTFIEETRRD